jgi:hypothetical protein
MNIIEIYTYLKNKLYGHNKCHAGLHINLKVFETRVKG